MADIGIFDLHADVFMDMVRRRWDDHVASGGPALSDAEALSLPPELASRHLARIRSGGIGGAALIDCRMAGEDARPEHLERFIRTVRLEMEALSDEVLWVRSAADLYRARKEGRFAAVVGYEGLTPAQGDLAWITRLYDEAGLRLAVLTHNDDNFLGGGALGDHGGAAGGYSLGLTEEGREAVSLMNKLGVLVDMSHAGKTTRRDILRHSTRPVMLSHTSAAAVYDNGRNLNDDELRAVAEKGGLVGCMTSPAALAPLADRERHTLALYVRHLTHMIAAAGVEHVGLGLHFCEYLYTEAEYPPVAGLEDASRAHGIVEALLDAGYSEDDVEKIAWGNFQRLFGDAVG